MIQKVIDRLCSKTARKAFRLCCRKTLFVPYKPLAIYVDATSLCNLKCEMCALHLLPKNRRGHLTYENFKKIIGKIPGHRYRLIEFPGTGEPLVNPEFLKIIKEAKERRFRTELYTNGTLINCRNVKEIVTYTDHIHFSLSGAKKNTYESIHLGAIFDNVIEGISLFARMKSSLKSNNCVTINFVASKRNYTEIIDMVKLTKNLNADELTINIVRKMNPEKRMDDYDDKIVGLRSMDENVLSEQLEMSFHLSEKLGIKFSVQHREKRFKSCIWPWRGCFITYDGFVTPCCLVTSPEIINFGNVFEKSFRRIWNGSEYKKFRRLLLSNSPPKCCRECGL